MSLLATPDDLVTADPITRSPHALVDLARFGDRVAVHAGDVTWTYADLRERVTEVAGLLGPGRRLILIESRNTVDSLVTVLATLQHGHVALLVPPGGDHRELVAAYDPDVTAGDRLGRWTLSSRRDHSAHDLHPNLALLLSTSGSTGSPKLVRLSHHNLRSNAAAIASYLGLTAADRAITTLPMHYCYGLSVLTSHLSVGASITLTELSVVDSCFWTLARDTAVTTLAGVPYTFELLNGSGHCNLGGLLPSLRQVTQAGGRMPREQVLEWAERGRRQGWDFVVMYGQTEATARMAYLPPHLALQHPDSVGIAIPGGRFRLDPASGQPEGVGELVYSGPNVMMGYAENAADLSRGATLSELRTGDLARCRDGLWEIVGRTGRHSKLFGLRLDLERIERAVDTAVHCVAGERGLHVFGHAHLVSEHSPDLAARVAHAAGLPVAAIRVHPLTEIPRTTSGKPDLAALSRHARELEATPHPASQAHPRTRPADERGLADLTDLLVADFAMVLGRPDADPGSSFVALGGDSLSYVELATRLGQRLGDLPDAWHTLTIAELARQRAAARGSRVDTSVLMRALGIVAIVGTHANLFTLTGGAHLLLGVAGFNLARFQLGGNDRADRIRHGLSSLVRLVVPVSLWVGAVAMLTGFYDWRTAVLLNQFRGTDVWTVDWQFWFLDAIAWSTLGALALLAIGPVHRLERRYPYGFALGVLAATSAVRYGFVGIEAGPLNRYTLAAVLWCIALGWLIARSHTTSQRLVTSVAIAVTTYGFFGEPLRETLIAAGLLALTWWPSVRVPAWTMRPLSVLAASSLFVYLTHWQVYPHWEDTVPWFATSASFAVGIAAWWGWTRLTTWSRHRIYRYSPVAESPSLEAATAWTSRSLITT